MKTRLNSAALVALLALSTGCAQDRGQTTGGASATAASAASATAGSLAQTDATFVANAAAGDMAEIQMAQMALERASTSAVRTYAQRMIQDHTNSSRQLGAIAQRKGIDLPQGPDPEAQAMMQELASAEGAAFDRTYMQSQVGAHQKMVGVYQTEVQGGRDPELRGFATQTLPIVQMHLQMAQQLAPGA